MEAAMEQGRWREHLYGLYLNLGRTVALVESRAEVGSVPALENNT